MVATDRGSEREALAKQLGANRYIDAAATEVGKALAALGGAKAVIATAPNAKAMSEAIDGLSVDGVLVALGVPEEPMVIAVRALLSGRKVTGSSGGASVEAEDAMKFGVQSGVRPIIETMPLERAAEAYDRMMAGQARFRIVLTTGL